MAQPQPPAPPPPPGSDENSLTREYDDRSPDGFWKYGRFYGSWRPDKYKFPIDSEELVRLDVFHKFFLEARQQETHSRKLRSDAPPRILDLGAGTGLWAINVAENIKIAEIISVDLNKIQPALIPRCMSTLQFDIEDENWDPLPRDCDLVHLRLMLGSIQTSLWPDIYSKVLDHLAPGTGFVELVEIDWTPQWDEGSDRPDHSSFQEWAEKYYSAMEKLNRSARVIPHRIRQMLEDAGFVDIREIPMKCYVNPWSRVASEREPARWLNLGFGLGIEAMSLAPMIEKEGMTKAEVTDLCAKAKTETCVLRYHAYVTLWIWSAKRPGRA